MNFLAAAESEPVEEVALPERADWVDMLRRTKLRDPCHVVTIEGGGVRLARRQGLPVPFGFSASAAVWIGLNSNLKKGKRCIRQSGGEMRFADTCSRETVDSETVWCPNSAWKYVWHLHQ